METLQQGSIATGEQTGHHLHALQPDRQKEILGQYTPVEQSTISHRLQILSTLGLFIGKDFRMPIELNERGEGWHWDAQENKIRTDPQDILEKPMDYLRFVISHEGGHRRISRIKHIPREVWQQPGFAFMLNANEDPRDNNFVAEAYPKFKEQMKVAYEMDLDFEDKTKGKAKEQLGYHPRFMQAGFEYIRQWFRTTQGQEMAISEDLPQEVKDVVQKTLPSAQDSWLRYPTREEADSSEDLISQYADLAYTINRDEVWPDFKTLVDEDLKDQQMQEALQDMQQGQGESGSGEGEGGKGAKVPQELQDKLTKEEQQALEDALDQAMQQGQTGEQREGKPSGKGKAIDLDTLPDSLKEKIKEYIASLPEEKQKELAEKAKQALSTFEEEVNKGLEGKLTDKPEEIAERSTQETSEKTEKREETTEQTSEQSLTQEEAAHVETFRDLIEDVVNKDEGHFEKTRREVLPIIDRLESELRDIFVQRRAQKWESGFKTGKKIDIKRRIQEKAKAVSAVESKAWQKRELPQEKDYAIDLLVDLSGSMQGQKIRETFKAAVVLGEVLNRLSIPTEILGFNDRLYVYQAFGEAMSQDVRTRIGSMPGEVQTKGAQWNDDGWAVQQASDRLAKEKATEKFLIVLSDGLPEPSPQHTGATYELGRVVKRTMQETDQKLIGLGIGRGTEHVSRYYPNSVANIDVNEMADQLANVLRGAIENVDAF